MSAPLKACRVLCQNRRVVATLPCIQTAINQMKAFSSFGSPRLPEDTHLRDLEDSANPNTDLNVIWPDTSLGPLANKDRRFPMPGSVGVGSLLQPNDQPMDELVLVDPTHVLQTRTEERKAVIDQFNFMAEMDAFSAPSQPVAISQTSGPHRWECSAQECPEILVKDFQELFPGRQLGSDQLTVITISHHTRNDMSMWSPEVEEEREGVLKTFIQGGEELCAVLKDMGYWADFVDPSSGRPYYGEYTNATLFETDERYRKLGFEIRDLGCCKVIAHHLWGTHTFLGSVFTNCPVDDPVLHVLLRNTN